MRGRNSIFPIVIILMASACLDPLTIDVGTAVLDTIVISGSITNDPGPYKVTLSTAFDLNSKTGERNPISATRVMISDNTGTSEELSEIKKGTYTTKEDGIRGVVGRTYTLRVEFSRGLVFESLPDTLLEPGSLDTLYHEFREGIDADNAATYGFDVIFKPVSNSHNNNHLMWKFTGTYQANTNPEYSVSEPCGGSNCPGCNICNYKPPCSGIRNISRFPDLPRAVFVRVGPCECCTCWYNFFNSLPLLSEGQFVNEGQFGPQKAMYIPLDPWVFSQKVHATVSQFTLTSQAFKFWTGINDQKNAVNSLFQPVTGKIKGNIVQVSGDPLPVEGLFFAAGAAHKSMFILPDDVPGIIPIPVPALVYAESCLKLAPYATTVKPDFWE